MDIHIINHSLYLTH